jgi:Bacterial regulatory helix-turn-helix protein, lysR family/LysR substrate binding domain
VVAGLRDYRLFSYGIRRASRASIRSRGRLTNQRGDAAVGVNRSRCGTTSAGYGMFRDATLRRPFHSSIGVLLDRLTAMETFVRVIEAGSFSELHVGQPAVSKMIAQLEDRLGVRLLLRSTHGLMPTEAGRNFYQRAKRAIEEAEEAELAARGAASALSGRLRVLAAVTFGRLHVVPLLPKFLAEHPALDIDVLLQEGPVDLVGAGIDVALRMTPFHEVAPVGRKIGRARRRALWGRLRILLRTECRKTRPTSHRISPSSARW